MTKNPRRTSGEGFECHCSDVQALTKFASIKQPPRGSILARHWWRQEAA